MQDQTLNSNVLVVDGKADLQAIPFGEPTNPDCRQNAGVFSEKWSGYIK